MKLTIYIGVVALSLLSVLAWADPASLYAGQQTRDIKALSGQEVQDYLDGKGMGLAKAAELNRYPGPAHVLELAAPLNLSAEQKQRTQDLFNRMQKKAANLGRLLVEEEQKLDRLFSTRTVTHETLSAALERIGKLQGEVRFAHLEAHLSQAEILSATQIARYVELRGYAGQATGHDGQSHKH